MSFPRYEKYKDSGVEWLGEVPEDWDIKRLKSIVEEPLKYGANESAELDDRTLPRFVRITDINNAGGLRDDTFKSLPLEIAEPYLLKEGDVLLARSGATVGKSFIYSVEWGTACFAGYLIRVRLNHTTCLAKWLYYFCQTDEYWGYVIGSQIQATIQNVSAEKYANLYLPLPRIHEQTQITAFLDRETAKIDELIAEQQRLIELLKEKRQAVISHAVTKALNPDVPMKDSGVEWLGEIPEHWVPKKIGAISSLKGRLGWQGLKAEEYRDHGPYVVSSAHFENHQIDWDACPRVSQERYDIDSNIQLAPNDVLLMKDGAAMGKLAFLESLPGPACLNSHLLLFRPVNADGDDTYFPRFAFYYMQTRYFQEFIKVNGTGATFLGISQEAIARYQIAMPPHSEQIAISTFLDKETAKLDTLTTEAQRAVSLLQERRTALISAAVTGKIKVTNTPEGIHL